MYCQERLVLNIFDQRKSSLRTAQQFSNKFVTLLPCKKILRFLPFRHNDCKPQPLYNNCGTKILELQSGDLGFLVLNGR